MSKHVPPDGTRQSAVKGEAGTINCVDFGGDGPTIVALHGVTGNAHLWNGFAAAMRGTARIIAFDLRGHGDSSWSDRHAYSTDDHVKDLRQVIDKFDIESPILAGSSWGALAAISYATNHAGDLQKLILVDVEPSFDSSAGDVAPRPRSFGTFDEALAWERKANSSAPAEDLENYTRMSLRREEDGTWSRKHDPFFFKCWPFRDDDRWAELRALTQPTLVIHGESSFIRMDVCRRMAKACPDGNFVEIPKSGHLVPLEQPVRLAAAIREFLAR